MEPLQPEQQPAPEPIRFRAGKKRKAYRQRSVAAEDDLQAVAAARRAPSPQDADLGRGTGSTNAEAAAGDDDNNSSDAAKGDDGDEDDGEEESAVATALRLRNARRAARLRGVGFCPEGGRLADDSELPGHALVLREADAAAAAEAAAAAGPDREATVVGITNRFMQQTGMLTHLDDKHMNAYIESRLASRNGPSGSPTAADPSSVTASTSATHRRDGHGPLAGGTAPSFTAPGSKAPPPHKLRDQPTKQGKLLEVDLPPDIRDRIHEQKRRCIEKPNKPPRRGRHRRNSDDIARDNLVEQFLHENRLDVYDVPSASDAPAASAPGEDPAADERLAEQFRQQYLNEQAARRKKKRPAQQQQQRQQQQQAGEVLKGPKLGGSRNARAAVRDILLQQEKEKKGKA